MVDMVRRMSGITWDLVHADVHPVHAVRLAAWQDSLQHHQDHRGEGEEEGQVQLR